MVFENLKFNISTNVALAYNTKIRAVFKWLLSTVRSSLIKFKE